MHSDKVKATAKSIGLVGGSLSRGGPKPLIGSQRAREREQRRQDRKKQKRGDMTTAASDVYDKAKGTTKY